MNRKERRAAKKQGRSAGASAPGALGASPGTQMFAAAFGQFRAGQTLEAERLCRDVLTFDPGHFDSLHLLGIMALRTGTSQPGDRVAWPRACRRCALIGMSLQPRAGAACMRASR